MKKKSPSKAAVSEAISTLHDLLLCRGYAKGIFGEQYFTILIRMLSAIHSDALSTEEGYREAMKIAVEEIRKIPTTSS